MVMLGKKAFPEPGSQKLRIPFREQYVVKEVLPNDRYLVGEAGRSGRCYKNCLGSRSDKESRCSIVKPNSKVSSGRPGILR